MPSCVYRRCVNFTPKSIGITYHAFPSSDELRLIKWIKIVRRQRREEDWLPSNSSRICSVHFKDEHKYKTSKGLTLLKKTAIPIFEDPWKHNRYSSYIRHEPGSPNSLDGENISDFEWIFNQPEKFILEKQINKFKLEKKRLQQRNNNLFNKNKRLKKHVASMRLVLKHLKNKKYISKEQFDDLNPGPDVVRLLNKLIPNPNTKKSIPQQYPPALRKFAVTLNSYSPAAYEYVRQAFHTALPHPRVFEKWYENKTTSPGFTSQVFDILKEKSMHSGKRLLCALVIDEVTLRYQSKWSGKRTDGVVDFGASASTTINPTEAFMFLLVSLNENWSLPVGYFLVKGVTAQTRAHLVTSCLSICFHSGIDVAAVTLDGSPDNFTAANILGCNLNDPTDLKTTFKHPECAADVALLFDPTHMIQLVRNTFESKKIILIENKKVISWQSLDALNKLQTNEQLTFSNTLSEQHVNFKNEIIKMRLTTQLFSRSIANALEISQQILESSVAQNTAATAEFIKHFNDLFDIFNSRSYDIYYFKNPICSNNSVQVFKCLDKIKRYILSLEIYNRIRRNIQGRVTISVTRKRLVDCKCNSGFLGFLVCIASLKHLYTSLVEINPKLRHIPTYRLRQDYTEVLFGVNNPNAVQFKSVYKKIINHIKLRYSRTGNCIPLESIPILNSSSAVTNINVTSGRRGVIDDEFSSSKEFKFTKSDEIAQKNADLFANILNDTREIVSVKYIVGYISGWIARKLVNDLKCEVCIDALLTQEKLWFHKLISIKYMGGLCYSTENVFIVCLKAENIIKPSIRENEGYFTSNNEIDNVKSKILKSFIDSNVFNNLHYHAMTQPPTFNHRLHLIKAIIDKYANLRFRSAHKVNPNFRNAFKKFKGNKLNLFEER